MCRSNATDNRSCSRLVKAQCDYKYEEQLHLDRFVDFFVTYNTGSSMVAGNTRDNNKNNNKYRNSSIPKYGAQTVEHVKTVPHVETVTVVMVL